MIMITKPLSAIDATINIHKIAIRYIWIWRRKNKTLVTNTSDMFKIQFAFKKT